MATNSLLRCLHQSQRVAVPDIRSMEVLPKKAMIDARQKGENVEHQKEVNAERQIREVEEAEIIIVTEEERGNNHLL